MGETNEAAALPGWLRREPVIAAALNRTIGAKDFRRLVELTSEAGGLSPTEAREWFAHDRRTWERVEAQTAAALMMSEHQKHPIPPHLARWLDDHRSLINRLSRAT